MVSVQSSGIDHLSVLVPADRIARVIGKQGAGLKSIREGSGLKVQAPPTSDTTATVRRVDISGNPEQIARGFVMVLEKAYHDEQISASAVMLPAEKAGSIIGKGGENLKRIRQSTNVKIELERDPYLNPDTNGQERYLSMQGDIVQMAQAMRFITAGAPALPSDTASALRAQALVAAAGGLPLPGVAAMAPAARPALSNVKAATENPEEVQLHMVIPPKLAGAIIGKGGAQVQDTATRAGCKVVASEKNSGTRRIVMIGHFGQCMIAQGLVHQQLMEAVNTAENPEDISEVTVHFLVRRECAGAVIGKGGEALKQMREATSCKIQMTKEEVMGHRACTIVGAYTSVIQAEKMIFELVRTVPVSLSPSGPAVTTLAQPSLAGHSGAGLATAGAPLATGGMGLMNFMDPSATDYQTGVKREAYDVLEASNVKRQRVDSAAQPGVQTKLLVPGEHAGAIIGKQGAGLKALRETHGVQVEMLKADESPQFPDQRVLLIKGSVQSRVESIDAVLRTAFATSPECTLRLLVPAKTVGGIIGKAGATLKTLREQYGANVQVHREEINGERLVTAQGIHSQVSAAAAAVVLLTEGGPTTGTAPALPAAPQPMAMPVVTPGYVIDPSLMTSMAGYPTAGNGMMPAMQQVPLATEQPTPAYL